MADSNDATGKNSKMEGKETKRQKRMLRNRISAQLHRQRQKDHVDRLTKELMDKEKECAELRRKVQELEGENEKLRRLWKETTSIDKSDEEGMTSGEDINGSSLVEGDLDLLDSLENMDEWNVGDGTEFNLNEELMLKFLEDDKAAQEIDVETKIAEAPKEEKVMTLFGSFVVLLVFLWMIQGSSLQDLAPVKFRPISITSSRLPRIGSISPGEHNARPGRASERLLLDGPSRFVPNLDDQKDYPRWKYSTALQVYPVPATKQLDVVRGDIRSLSVSHRDSMGVSLEPIRTSATSLLTSRSTANARNCMNDRENQRSESYDMQSSSYVFCADGYGWMNPSLLTLPNSPRIAKSYAMVTASEQSSDKQLRWKDMYDEETNRGQGKESRHHGQHHSTMIPTQDVEMTLLLPASIVNWGDREAPFTTDQAQQNRSNSYIRDEYNWLEIGCTIHHARFISDLSFGL